MVTASDEFYDGKQFLSFKELQTAMQTYARRSGFSVSVNSKEKNRRGHFYCSYKPSRGLLSMTGKRLRSTCTFQVNYRPLEEWIELSKCNLHHNHPIEAATQATPIISLECDLTEEEHKELSLLATTTCGITGVKEIMRARFPKRDYDTSLISRILSKNRINKYGTNGIKQLLDFGETFFQFFHSIY
jgi:hypothetical protein